MNTILRRFSPFQTVELGQPEGFEISIRNEIFESVTNDEVIQFHELLTWL